MISLKSIYKIKNLAGNGLFILISIIILLILGTFIPEFVPDSINKPMATLNGVTVKHDDTREVPNS